VSFLDPSLQEVYEFRQRVFIVGKQQLF
jgi:hypothetical protein